MKRVSITIFLVFALFFNLNAEEITIDTISSYHNRDIEEPITVNQIDSGFLIADTLIVVKNATNTQTKESKFSKSNFHPNPSRSVWLGLLFPGLGQIYNRSYWKLPIIYGGFAGCYYAIQWNNRYYKTYLAAYMDVMDSDPNTQYNPKLLPAGADPKTHFNQRQNYYRKYRDLSIIITVGVYVLSIVDAFVDAQLHDFDISSDVSMKIQPTLIENPQSTTLASTALGMSFKVKF